MVVLSLESAADSITNRLFLRGPVPAAKRTGVSLQRLASRLTAMTDGGAGSFRDSAPDI